jgi:quercetin 2,3-dioxygenase
MIDQSQGIIYISEQREKTIIGAKTQAALININDNYLDGGLGYCTKTPENCSVLIIPYIGDIEFIQANKKILVEENQAILLSSSEQMTYEVSNPYNDNAINFYEILIDKKIFDLELTIVDVDIQKKLNQLIEIYQNIKIGQFQSRKEYIYNLENFENNIFIYVISGAFEVQNRLLKSNDSLLLWNLKLLEFEALTNEAVILIFEFKK